MKRNFYFAMLSAVALAGAMTFTACTSEDDANVNPTFDGEAVKTTFSISLPGNVARTRMAYEKVQASEAISDFRGMSNIVIVPYRNATERTTRLGKNITLWYNTQARPTASTNAENSIPQGKLLAESNAVLFNDVSVPLNTSGFLFYGKATGDDGYANGKLTVTGMGDIDEITAKTFTPTPIVDNVSTTKGVALAAYVTDIASATNWAACADPANHTDANQAWYNANLGELYTNFTSMKAGASQYIQAAVQDLYSSILVSNNSVALAIKTKILTKATDDGNGNLTFDASISGYPEDDNNFMPAGAAALTWSGATPNVATAVAANTNNSMTVNMATVAYPASLWYFVDSPLSTANASKAEEYNGTQNWATILGKYTDGATVNSSTRSIAINKPIQYGVGRLDAKVGKLTRGTYYDRKGNVVNIGSGFTFTGVLIGGQKAVNWKFEQSGSDEYTIYDKTINTSTEGSNTLSASVDAGTNYTLALETAESQKIRVALEFLNLGDDFYGADGVVKKNCKFYMIAELDPEGTEASKPSGLTVNKVFIQDHKTIANFSIAAGDDDSDNDGWAENPAGFANAYVTIPDLRTPLLELGFSVDLHWEEGITFTHEF